MGGLHSNDDTDCARINRLIGEALRYYDKMNAGTLTPDDHDQFALVQAEVTAELKRLGVAVSSIPQLLDYFSRKDVGEWEINDFYERFVNRQGTTMPDFAALYEKKAAIDEKSLDEFGIPPTKVPEE